MKKAVRVLAPFMVLCAILCIPQVSERLPKPMDEAFKGVRENVVLIAKGQGGGKVNWKDPRGLWQTESSGGVENVGGR